ncbi:hypothetical protein VE03_03473 [Pseudogymnoascus sp. 23342-1-I1]|nr:hypothetical protein VE03_03473 [Pseudogymnoascus sp. 23342-1-I1]
MGTQCFTRYQPDTYFSRCVPLLAGQSPVTAQPPALDLAAPTAPPTPAAEPTPARSKPNDLRPTKDFTMKKAARRQAIGRQTGSTFENPRDKKVDGEDGDAKVDGEDSLFRSRENTPEKAEDMPVQSSSSKRDMIKRAPEELERLQREADNR